MGRSSSKFKLTLGAMQETFGRLNAELFGGQLAAIPLRMSNSVRRGGTYRATAEFVQKDRRLRRLLRNDKIENLRDESIIISKKLCLTQEILEKFLAHEMVHQWQSEVMGVSEDNGGHGELFHRKADEINLIKGPGFVTVTSDVVAGETGGKEGQVYHVVLFDCDGRKLGGFSRRPFGDKEMEIIERTAKLRKADYRILTTTSHDAQVLIDVSRMRAGVRRRSWTIVQDDIYESIVSKETTTSALRSARLRIADLSGIMLYHGTSLDIATVIARQGVKSFLGDQWSANSAVVNTDTNAIYLTPDFELAMRYALGFDGDSTPAILECRIAGRHMKKLRTDRMDAWESTWDEHGNAGGGLPDRQEELDGLQDGVRQFLSKRGVSMSLFRVFPDDIDEYDGLNLYKLVLKYIRKSVPEDRAREVFLEFREEFSPDDYGFFHIRPDGTVRLDSSYWSETHQLQYSRGQGRKEPVRLPPAAIKAVWIPAEMAPSAAEVKDVSPRNLPEESKVKLDKETSASKSVSEWADALEEATTAEDIGLIEVGGRYIEDIDKDDPEPLQDVLGVAQAILESPDEDHSQLIRDLRENHEFYDPSSGWGEDTTYGESIKMAKVSLEMLTGHAMAASLRHAAVEILGCALWYGLRSAALDVFASSGTIVAYHATLSGSDILKGGFKKSDEVERVGLGGSSHGGSVSFTTDWGVVTGIHKSFVMMHELVNADDPLAAIKEHFELLDPSLMSRVLSFWESAHGGDLKELLGGWKPRPYGVRAQTYDQLVQQGFKPVHAAGDEGGEGSTLYYQWLEPVTNDDAEKMVYTYVKVYFFANEGEYNPVFMGGAASYFKGIPREDIGVFTVKLHIDPSKKEKDHGGLYNRPSYAILPAESEYRISDMSMIGKVLDYDTHPGDEPKVRADDEVSFHSDAKTEEAVNKLLSLLQRHRGIIERGRELDVRQAMALLRNADDMWAVSGTAGKILAAIGLKHTRRAIEGILDLQQRSQPSDLAAKAIAALPPFVRSEVERAAYSESFADISERWYDRDESSYTAWATRLSELEMSESVAESEINDWISSKQWEYERRIANEVKYMKMDVPGFREEDAADFLELAIGLEEASRHPLNATASMMRIAIKTVFEAGDPSKSRYFILRRGKLWLWSNIDLGGADETRLVESIREEFGTDQPPFDQKFPIDNQYRVRDMFEPNLFGSASDEDTTRFREFASDTLVGTVLQDGTLRVKTVSGHPVHANHPEMEKLLKHLGVEAERPQTKGVWYHGFIATPKRMDGVSRFGLRPGDAAQESNWEWNEEYDRSLVYLTTDAMIAKMTHATGNEGEYPYSVVVSVRENDLDRTRMEADFDAARGGFKPNRAGLVGYRGRIPVSIFSEVRIYRNGYNQGNTPLLLTLDPDEFSVLAKEYAAWAARTKEDREALGRAQRNAPSFTDRELVQRLDDLGRDPILQAVDAAKAVPLEIAASLSVARERIREVLHG